MRDGAWRREAWQRKARFTISKKGVIMIHEKSADTQLIESVLAEAKVGDVITYEQLSKVIGRDVRQFALSSLSSARRGIFNSKRYVFGVEKNVGLKRLNDNEIVDSTEYDRKKLRRAAKRTLNKLGVVDFDNLTPDKKRQHIVASAQMGAVEMFAGKNATKKIEAKVNETSRVLPIGETLRMFG